MRGLVWIPRLRQHERTEVHDDFLIEAIRPKLSDQLRADEQRKPDCPMRGP